MQNPFNYFETKVSYDMIDIDGNQKRQTDTRLVAAVTVTEAESIVTEIAKPYIRGEFEVSSVKKAKFYEIFSNPSGEKWYKGKIQFIIFDVEKNTEKREKVSILVQADSVKEATAEIEEQMKGTMSDYELTGVMLSSIVEVVFYETTEDPQNPVANIPE